MILFAILLITLVIMAITIPTVVLIVGGNFIVMFGDVIVCAVLIVLIMKLFRKRKRK